MRKAMGRAAGPLQDLTLLLSSSIVTRNFIKPNRRKLSALAAAEVNGARSGVSFALAPGTAVTDSIISSFDADSLLHHRVTELNTRLLSVLIAFAAGRQMAVLFRVQAGWAAPAASPRSVRSLQRAQR